MEVKKIQPPTTGFLEVRLDRAIVDYLWMLIDKSNLSKINHKSSLAGNISISYVLEDDRDYFYKQVCEPLITYFRKHNYGKDPEKYNVISSSNPQLTLNRLWVNYQYQNEFNPYHDHRSLYSFTIWLKIPYDWENQARLPQFVDMNDNDKKAGNFEFEYIDSLGKIRNYAYKLSPSLEGTMLFFPAALRHCVYPFHCSSDPRISVAGNISFKQDK